MPAAAPCGGVAWVGVVVRSLVGDRPPIEALRHPNDRLEHAADERLADGAGVLA
jgi:hypothetical protein